MVQERGIVHTFYGRVIFQVYDMNHMIHLQNSQSFFGIFFLLVKTYEIISLTAWLLVNKIWHLSLIRYIFLSWPIFIKPYLIKLFIRNAEKGLERASAKKTNNQINSRQGGFL